MRRAAVAVAVVALLGAPRAAIAGAFEVEGFGPTGVAAAGARAARASDGTATFYSPGGLAFGRGVEIEIAPTFAASALTAQKDHLGLDDPFGVAVALAVTIPLEGALHDRIRFGFGGYFLPSGVLHLVTHHSDEPFYPYFDNRTQRLVLLPTLAVKVTERLGIGAGVNVLGGVAGPASVLPGASGAPESRLDLQATTTAALNLGARFDLTPRVHLALTFRQRFAVPSKVSTTAEIGGIPLQVDVGTGAALYDPTTVVLAAGFDLGRTSVELDAAYAAWSAYGGPFVNVHATLPGLDVSSDLPAGLMRDVVSLRAAGEHRFDVGARSELGIHAGLGFEPSMLTGARQGRTNLVDGDKLLGGLGVTLAIRDVLSLRALRFGAGIGASSVLPSTRRKQACLAEPCGADTVVGPDATDPSKGITNPGFPALLGSGALVTGSLSLGVDL